MPDTIAVVFDFDDTLGPDSTSGLLQSLGADVEIFWRQDVQALIDSDWDPVTASASTMAMEKVNGNRACGVAAEAD